MLFYVYLFYYCLKKNNLFYFSNFFYNDYYSFYINLLNMTIMVSFYLMNISFLTFVYLNFIYLILNFVFFSISFFQFYIFFELSLIPIFLIIMQNGKQFERLKAGTFLFFFTLLSSLPFFIMIILLLNMNMKSFSDETYKLKFFSIMMIFLYIVFFIKIPLYFFHMWLPKAHVQAPVYGSMILASVLLKLGGYGLMKIVYFTFFVWLKFMKLFLSIMMIGILISSLMCIFLTDLKIIIALSSVSHMTFFISSFSILTFEGLKGGLLMMISHGFSSSLMFFYFNTLYLRTLTRSVFLSKSVSFSLYFLNFLIVICGINFNLPPSLNFFSEMILLFSFSWLKVMYFIMFIMMFVNTMFCMLLFISIKDFSKNISFGSLKIFMNEFSMLLYKLMLIYISLLMIFKIM